MQATTNVYVKDSSRNNMKKMSRSSKVMDPISIPEELADLMRDTEEHKNYSGGLFAILVICLLLGLIGLVTYLTMPKTGPVDHLVPVFFPDIFKIARLNRKLEYEWKDGHLIFRNSTGHFYSIKLSGNSTQPSVILSKQHYVKGMSLSFDLQVWLIPVHERESDNLERERAYKLYYMSRNSPSNRPIVIGNTTISYISDIAWGPKAKYMVAIYKNNIYYSLNALEAASFICITCNIDQSRSYGRLLGYYRDGIFKSSKAYWWNTNGQLLAFLSLVDGADKRANVEIFDSQSLYSMYRNISYAKAGSSPSLYTVGVHVFNIASQELYSLPIDEHTLYKPYYIVHIQWYNGSTLLATLLSADQTRVTVLLCDVTKADCFSVLDRTVSRWTDLGEYQRVAMDREGGHLYMALTVPGDSKCRRHIASIKVDRRKHNMIMWLNIPAILHIIRVDVLEAASRSLYFLATRRGHEALHLYKVDLRTEESTCESCGFTSCNRSDVHSYGEEATFIHRCLGPEPEIYRLIRLIAGSYQAVDLETNPILRDHVTNKSLPVVEYSTILISQQHRKYRLFAKIAHPRILNPNHVIQYPAMLILSDSPSKQIANEDFDVGWVDYVTSYLQYVVIKIDVRGTDDSKPYLPLPPLWAPRNGHVDLLVAAMKEILLNRSYIDNSSIGVIGESYGGYLAARLLSNDIRFPQFRCGVALSPIVDFESYDAFFSEHYLGTYNRYRREYENSRLQASVLLKKKELLLVYREAEDNVIFDAMAKFLKDLVEQNILFDLLLMYQGKNTGGMWQQNRYALKKITKFFVNCFNRSSVQYSVLENDTMNTL